MIRTISAVLWPDRIVPFLKEPTTRISSVEEKHLALFNETDMTKSYIILNTTYAGTCSGPYQGCISKKRPHQGTGGS